MNASTLALIWQANSSRRRSASALMREMPRAVEMDGLDVFSFPGKRGKPAMEAGVQRWAVDATEWVPSAAQFNFLLSLLPLCEWRPVLRYVRVEDRKRTLLSRLLQRMLVHSVLAVPFDDIIINRTPQGKPFLANSLKEPPFPNFNFNVGHHGDYVVIASEPVCLVGVDVMAPDAQIKEDPLEYIKNFRSCFSKLEWDNIVNAGPEGEQILGQFHRYWCFKEAYIKAVGIGLGFELQRIEFFYPGNDIWAEAANIRIDGKDETDWSFVLHQLKNGHWVCVARGPPDQAVESYKRTLQRVEFDDDTYALGLQLSNASFQTLTVEDLIPANKKQEFLEL